MSAIAVQNLTKIYRLYASPRDRLKEVLSLNRRSYHRDFYALNDISFTVEKGETIGIIGQNGSGKSTLLQIVCGVLQPSAGGVMVNGRVSALLELGAGFNPEFTGRDNVYMNGALLGITRDEMERRLPEIESFADIGEFIDQPVKTYSSGMFVRLAFAAAVHVDPDILIVDEALAVGDVLFQAKCFAKFRQFQKAGRTIAFVTHALDLVTTYCSRAILMDRGVLVDAGTPKTIVDTYSRIMTSRANAAVRPDREKEHASAPAAVPAFTETEWDGMFRINPNEDRYGERRAEIIEAGIFTLSHEPAQIVERNREYLVKVKVRHNEKMPGAVVAWSIKDPKGVVLCGTNTMFENVELGEMEEGDTVVVTFRQPIRVNAGEYLLCLGCATVDEKGTVTHDRRWDYMPFQVISGAARVGLFDPESSVEWTRAITQRNDA